MTSALDGSVLRTFEVLGPLLVCDSNGAEIELRGALQRRLLAALLLHRGRVISVDRLTEMLWTDGDLPNDSGALQSQMFRLRQRMPGLNIEHRGSGYVLHVGDAELDVDQFEHAVWHAVAQRVDDPVNALDRVEAALALWRGVPYDDLVENDDVRIEIERLQEIHLRATEERFRLMVDMDRGDEVLADLEAFVAREPLREQSRSLLIDALVASGRRADALRVFDSYRRVLAQELGVAPSVELRTRHDRLLAEDNEMPAVAATERVARSSRAPLRRTSSSFVGRDGLVRDLERQVGEARLVTLLGPGGIGKTRLAIETARRLEPRFPDGVVFCDLTAAGPARVVTVVAGALGVEPRAGQDEFDRLTEVMRRDRCLLVLDNCEHVVDEAAALAEVVLGETEQVVVIATSRVRLAVDGEHLCVVPSLSCELDDAGERSPAAALLVDRARAVRPGFDLGDGGNELVDELCRRLDGLPLAIELAAARMQSLSLQEISDGFEQSISVLHGGRRTVDRHRSVAAALEWSYELLDHADREALRAAAMFAAPFDPSDVAAILQVDQFAAQERLARLVECSLAQRVGTRFGLLDIVRRFAAERVGEDTTLSTWSQRHAERMLWHAEEISSLLRTAPDSFPVDEMSRLVADFRKALDTALGRDDADTSLRLVVALRETALNSMSPELMGWGAQAAELGERTGHLLTPDGFAAAAQGAWKRSDLAEMRRLLGRALDSAARLGVGDRFDVLGTLATEDLAHGRLASAVDRIRRAGELEEAIGDPLREAEFGATLAICMSYAHDPDAVVVADRLVNDVAPTVGAVGGAWCWYAAGECRLDAEPDVALANLERAVQLARDGGSLFIAGVAGASIASLHVRAGRLDAAVGVYRWLLPMWLRAGVRSPFWTAMRSVAELLARTGADTAAARVLGAVMAPTAGHEVFGDDDARLTSLRTELEDRLGPQRFAEAFESGSTLDDAAAALEATTAFDSIG